MPTSVKICGLSTPETVRAALDGGAGYVGFVFFDKSPRNVTPEDAARLAEPARAKGVKVVAVTVDPDDVLLDHLRNALRPDLIQLHGRELPGRVREVSERLGSGVIKAISVSGAAALTAANRYDPVTEHPLFHAPTP